MLLRFVSVMYQRIITGRIALICLLFFVDSCLANELTDRNDVQPLQFPQFSYKQHPLFQDQYFNEYSEQLSPVIMSRYYRHVPSMNARRNDLMLFAVGKATYSTDVSSLRKETGWKTLFENLDILLVSGFGKPASSSEKNQGGLEVHLTRRARVFVLLYGSKIHPHKFSNEWKVDGLDENMWQVSGAKGVYLPNNITNVVGDKTRVGDRFHLPRTGVLIESVQPVDYVRLPHPSEFQVDGKTVKRYSLLFARDDNMDTIRRIPYPSIPNSAPSCGNGPDLQNLLKPVPNRLCPAWLHDLWRVNTRDEIVAQKLGELMHWRTWHPSIDPVFWCYYDHEHGSYPGNHKPMFGYTAWKTPDDGTANGRQDESHEGFKVFSFSLENSRKFVVIVAHMHVAVPRRFRVRHHTVSFAILDEIWNLELELHMKMDFGAAVVTLKDKSDIPINEHEERILTELRGKGRRASRRFNVLNIDEGYPDTVDDRYLRPIDDEPTEKNLRKMLRGIYEKWSGPLNSCMKSRSGLNKGMIFDIRNPSTGLRSKTTSPTTFRDGKEESSLQQLSGNSGNRMIVIPERTGGIDVGIEYCRFDVFRSETGINLQTTAGVFYTDPYFEVVHHGPGDFSIRQFIRHDLETIHIPHGKIIVQDPWPSGMSLGEHSDKSKHFMNAENAVLPHRN